MTEGYVYLITEWDNIEEGKNHVKIGVTTGSIENRLKKLQTGNASELHVLNSYKTSHPFKLEKMLHMYYHNKHLYGEWYNLTDEEIVNFASVCNEKQNIINILQENPFF